MAVSSAPPAAPRRRLGWRYSLRGLLIVVTLACVGLWYWYRVPFSKELDHSKEPVYFRREAAGRVYFGREVQRFRRVLSGAPIREGLTEIYGRDGLRLHEEHWREGVLYGPMTTWYTSGKVRERGQFHLGRIEGTWEKFDELGKLAFRSFYDGGRPHGDWQRFEDGKLTCTIRFEQGEATQVNGHAFRDPLGGAFRQGEIDNEAIGRMMLQPTFGDFKETPLSDVVGYIIDSHGVPGALSRKCRADVRITYRDVPRMTTGAMLVLLLEPYDLVATHRFGMVWITTQEDAASWVDRTGTDKLPETPPADASLVDQQKVRAALEKPAQFDFFDTPAVDISGYLTDTYGISLVANQSVQDGALTSSLRGITLQNALGALCEQHDLRIRWTEGTTLMFERQEEEK